MKKPKAPSVFLVIMLVCAACVYLPDTIVSALASNSGDFLQHHWLQGILRLFSYQFMHANTDHFRGNFLVACGPAMYLEAKLGGKKFLMAWLWCGIVSALLFLGMTHISTLGHLFEQLSPQGMVLIGASGSIFGILTLALLTHLKGGIWSWVFAAVAIAYIFVPQVGDAVADLNFPTGVAHMGHVGGMLGALLLFPVLERLPKRGQR